MAYIFTRNYNKMPFLLGQIAKALYSNTVVQVAFYCAESFPSFWQMARQNLNWYPVSKQDRMTRLEIFKC